MIPGMVPVIPVPNNNHEGGILMIRTETVSLTVVPAIAYR